MKKIGVALLLFGLVMVILGGVLVYDTQMKKEPEFDLKYLVDNHVSFFHEDDESFSMMNFVIDDDTFVVQIRKKKMLLDNGKYNGNSYSLQYPIEIKQDKIVNKKEKFTISYLNNVFTFTSEDTLINNIFGGDYSLSIQDFVIPDSMFDNNQGVFQSDEDNLLYFYQNDDGYIIDGVIKKDNMNILVHEVLDMDYLDEEFYLEKYNLTITFSSDTIYLDEIKYHRINALTRNNIEKELNNYSLYSKMYGAVI